MTASVLISVYHKESATTLTACLDSLVAQSRMPDTVVLVKDGPLDASLEAVIGRFTADWPDLFTIIALTENLGLVTALNRGLEVCDTDYVLRMDADDLAAPERFERQLAFMDAHPEVAVLGTAMYEFITNPASARVKPVKESHNAIVRQLPWRNPINHPTVCFRTDVVRDMGGYPDLPLLEDYFLWAKLAEQGHCLHNLAEPLHYYRFDDETLKRRSGWANFRNECNLRLWMYRQGLVGLPGLLATILLQGLLRFAPTGAQRLLWGATRN